MTGGASDKAFYNLQPLVPVAVIASMTLRIINGGTV